MYWLTALHGLREVIKYHINSLETHVLWSRKDGTFLFNRRFSIFQFLEVFFTLVNLFVFSGCTAFFLLQDILVT